jgi:hypothetical protein
MISSSPGALQQRNILIIAMNAMINIQEHGVFYDEDVSAITHAFLHTTYLKVLYCLRCA